MSNIEPQGVSTDGGPHLKFTNQANSNIEYSLSVLTNPGGQVSILNPEILYPDRASLRPPRPICWFYLPTPTSYTPRQPGTDDVKLCLCSLQTVTPWPPSGGLIHTQEENPKKRPVDRRGLGPCAKVMWSPRYTEHGVDLGFAKFSVNGHIINMWGSVGLVVSIIAT